MGLGLRYTEEYNSKTMNKLFAIIFCDDKKGAKPGYSRRKSDEKTPFSCHIEELPHMFQRQ
jgi:hypothetical protein